MDAIVGQHLNEGKKGFGTFKVRFLKTWLVETEYGEWIQGEAETEQYGEWVRYDFSEWDLKTVGDKELLRTQFTIAPNLFSKLTKLKTKFGISCFKEGVSTALKSRYHPVLCVSYLVFVLAFLENLRFGLQFGLARKRNLVV